MVNYAQTTASIARSTMPNIYAVQQPDLSKGIVDAINSYYDVSQKQTTVDALKNEEKIKENVRKLLGGNIETPEQAYAVLDPLSYAKGQIDFENQKYLLGEQAMQDQILQELRNQGKSQTTDMRNYEFLLSQGTPEEEARNLAFGNKGVNVNLNPFEKKRIENIAKDIDENINTSQARVEDYNRMEQLLNSPNVSTGGITGQLKKVSPSFFLNKEEQELQSLINKIVPQMRPAGSGSTSDKDMAIFEKATVGLDKGKGANLNIVRGRRTVDENAIAREELRADWVSNGGSLSEFDKRWREYLSKNPIFSNKNADLNQNRVNPYDWFSGKKASVQEQTKQEDFDPLGLF